MVSNGESVRPFRIEVPDDVLDDLRSRLARTRWPEAETVDDWSQGIPLAYARSLADYWAHDYRWREREAALNRFDQFVTEIDGLDIHVVHQRSPHDDAFPLLITHGWPGSIVEFHKVIEPLTNPPSGRAADAFHVVCPSLPGYGFSGKPTRTGWGVEKIAQAWETLMLRLGYTRYGAQGGDWGSAVTTQIGRNDSGEVERAVRSSTSLFERLGDRRAGPRCGPEATPNHQSDAQHEESLEGDQHE